MNCDKISEHKSSANGIIMLFTLREVTFLARVFVFFHPTSYIKNRIDVIVVNFDFLRVSSVCIQQGHNYAFKLGNFTSKSI